ncbi:hypothetical protein [Mycobacterium sherrisii]|uniref:hypothetical protein n=1 Tax=Mycobacterium sherrisii TaxID=243061 RepID=UPI0012F48FBF|nr:hypothetical protein [Mycobacterium sherrisii]
MSIDNHAVERCGSYDIRLEGDRALHASVGMFGLSTTPELVCVSIPDPYGNSTVYNFTLADWARIVDLIKRAEEVES